MGCNKSHIFFDRSPGQQPRFLKYEADPRAGRTRDASLKVGVEAGENPEHRTLAATGRADQDAYFSGIEGKGDAGDHVVLLARRVPECFAGDIDFKPHGDATGITGPQMAAPARFQ